MREKFVPLMKCLSLLLCSLGAYCKADPCGLLLYSRRQELAGLASHWVCVMHSFCPTPYCWADEAGDITLDDKAIPKWLQVELNGEMGWGCRGACHLDQHCDFICLLKKKVLCRNRNDYTFKFEVFYRADLLLHCCLALKQIHSSVPLTAHRFKLSLPVGLLWTL